MADIKYKITLTEDGANAGPIFDAFYSIDCFNYTASVDGQDLFLPFVGSQATITIPDNAACIKLVNDSEECEFNFVIKDVDETPTPTPTGTPTPTPTQTPTTTPTPTPSATPTATPTSTPTPTPTPTAVVYSYYSATQCDDVNTINVRSTSTLSIGNVVKIFGTCYEIDTIGGGFGFDYTDLYGTCNECLGIGPTPTPTATPLPTSTATPTPTPLPCNCYSAENTSGQEQTVFWNYCASGIDTNYPIANGSTHYFCATGGTTPFTYGTLTITQLGSGCTFDSDCQPITPTPTATPTPTPTPTATPITPTPGPTGTPTPTPTATATPTPTPLGYNITIYTTEGGWTAIYGGDFTSVEACNAVSSGNFGYSVFLQKGGSNTNQYPEFGDIMFYNGTQVIGGGYFGWEGSGPSGLDNYYFGINEGGSVLVDLTLCSLPTPTPTATPTPTPTPTSTPTPTPTGTPTPTPTPTGTPTPTPTTDTYLYFFLRGCPGTSFENQDIVVRSTWDYSTEPEFVVTIYGSCFYHYGNATLQQWLDNAGDLDSVTVGNGVYTSCTQCQLPPVTPTPTATPTGTPTPTPTNTPTPSPTGDTNIYYYAQPCSGGGTTTFRSTVPLSVGSAVNIEGFGSICFQVGASGAPTNTTDITQTYSNCSSCLPTPTPTATPTGTPTSTPVQSCNVNVGFALSIFDICNTSEVNAVTLFHIGTCQMCATTKVKGNIVTTVPTNGVFHIKYQNVHMPFQRVGTTDEGVSIGSCLVCQATPTPTPTPTSTPTPTPGPINRTYNVVDCDTEIINATANWESTTPLANNSSMWFSNRCWKVGSTTSFDPFANVGESVYNSCLSCEIAHQPQCDNNIVAGNVNQLSDRGYWRGPYNIGTIDTNVYPLESGWIITRLTYSGTYDSNTLWLQKSGEDQPYPQLFTNLKIETPQGEANVNPIGASVSGKINDNGNTVVYYTWDTGDVEIKNGDDVCLNFEL